VHTGTSFSALPALVFLPEITGDENNSYLYKQVHWKQHSCVHLSGRTWEVQKSEIGAENVPCFVSYGPEKPSR